MRWFVFVCACAVAAAAFGCAAGAGKGAEEPTPEEEFDVMRLSKPSREHMLKVRAHVDKKEWDAALAELERMKERKFLDDYERAVMWQAFGGLYYERGDFELSAAAGEEALKHDVLPPQTTLRTQRMLGELYLQMERFDRAAALLSTWVAGAKAPTAGDRYVVASALAQNKEFAEALVQAKLATAGRGPKDAPKEEWLRLELSLHYELKDEAQVLATLERLAAAYPQKREYRLQMVESHRALGHEAEALATMERAYQDKLFREERDFTNLAQLYLDAEQPLKAAQLLDVHFTDGSVARTPENLLLSGKAWALGGDEAKAKEAVEAAEKASATASSLAPAPAPGPVPRGAAK